MVEIGKNIGKISLFFAGNNLIVLRTPLNPFETKKKTLKKRRNR